MTPAGENLRATIIANGERAIQISLAGPLAERRKRIEITATKPDMAEWRRHYDPMSCVAFHEAGHAVACRLLGEPVQLISIVPRANSLGRCVGGDKPVPLDCDSAPGVSDRKEIARQLEWVSFVRGLSNRQHAWVEFRRLKRETNEMLERHWHFVGTVANRLLVRLEMERDEIEALLRGLRPECRPAHPELIAAAACDPLMPLADV
jgi:hypothetical protein